MKYFNKIKFDLKKTIYYIYLGFILFGIILILGTYYFLYNNFYLSITKVDEILTLQNQVAIESLNLAKFDNIIKKIDEKTSANVLDKIKDPFD